METEELFKAFFALVSTYALIYFIGHFVVAFQKNGDAIKSNFFTKLSIGLLLVPTFQAILKTGGITILAGNILLIALAFFQGKKRINISANSFLEGIKKVEKEFFISFLVLIVLFIVQTNEFVEFFSGKLKYITDDYAFYSRLATYFNDFGAENTNLEYFLSYKGGVLPYHYSEIWLTAFVKSVFSIHAQQALMLVCFPILFTSIYAGCLEIVKVLKQKMGMKVNFTDYLLSLVIFLISLFAFLYPSWIPILAMDIWVIKLMGMQKLAFIYFYCIWILLLLLQEKCNYLAYVAALLSISYITVTPALFLALGLFYLYELFRKRMDFKELLRTTLPLLITLIYIAIFYKTFGGKSNIALDEGDLFSQFFEFSYYRTFLNIIVKMSIQIIIVSSPFVALFLIYRRKIEEFIPKLAIFLFITVGSALFSWAFFWKMHDSVQLYGNLFNPLINVSAFVLVVLVVLINKRKKNIIFLSVLLLVSLIDPVRIHLEKDPNIKDLKYNSESIKSVIPQKQPIIAYFKEAKDYTVLFDRLEQVYSGHMNSLTRYFDPFQAVCLSVHNIPADNTNDKRVISATTFYKYYDEKSSIWPDLTITEAQKEFIEEFSIDYIFMSKARKLPEIFEDKFSSTRIGEIDGFSIYKRR